MTRESFGGRNKGIFVGFLSLQLSLPNVDEERKPITFFSHEGLIFCLNYSTVPPLLKVTKGTQKESRIAFQSHHSFQGSVFIFNSEEVTWQHFIWPQNHLPNLRKAGGLGVNPCFLCFPFPVWEKKGVDSTLQLENREKSTAIFSPPSNRSHRRTATYSSRYFQLLLALQLSTSSFELSHLFPSSFDHQNAAVF